MAEYIEREKAIELLSEPITMSMCLTMDECHHKIAQRRIDLYLIENIHAADVVPASDFRDCRNELCLKCGAYTQKHNGACDGCRWRQT